MLEKYLKDPANSVARETILRDRLKYDLRLAAVKRGYYLKIYSEDVDKDGFDIILDDDDEIIKTQLKSVSGVTPEWAIHKHILRPDPLVAEDMNFEPSPTGTGASGGIILIELCFNNDDLEVFYHYTDICIILAFYLQIITRNHRE
ncbi:MAG: hypothetical protein GY756_14460, partial [bacterium]|nr:hypothetical protein [bacterium]